MQNQKVLRQTNFILVLNMPSRTGRHFCLLPAIDSKFRDKIFSSNNTEERPFISNQGKDMVVSFKGKTQDPKS